MRCPKCKFISADKRDLCPKCLLDLRPEKKRLGLPISRPKTSYEELIKLAKNKRSKTNKAKPDEASNKSELTLESKAVVAAAPKEIAASEIKKPIWSRLLTKFTLSTSKKKIVVEEKLTITSIEAKELQKVHPPKDLHVEAAKVGIDEKAFESIFEETSEVSEPIKAVQSEPTDDDFIKLGEEMSLKLAQALSSTELLRELPNTTYVSQISQATPEVVEFDEDDDALLEEKLDQLLGDEIVEISSVKVPKKIAPPQANSIRVDDLEISFEFDIEPSEQDASAQVQEQIETPADDDDDENQEVVEEESPSTPSFETKSINQLEAALLALDAEFEKATISLNISEEELDETSEDESEEDDEGSEEIDNLDSLKNDLLGLEDLESDSEDSDEEDQFDLSLLKGSIPGKLKGSPIELSNYLLEVLADTVGCRTEELFNDELVEPLLSEEAPVETVGQDIELDAEDDNDEEGEDDLIDETEIADLLKELDAEEPQEEVIEEQFIKSQILAPNQATPEMELSVIIDSSEEIIQESQTISKPTLWDLAEVELDAQEIDGEELELTQLVPKDNREELIVLFDAALAALEDKKLEAGYRTKIKVSENKELDAEDLAIVFEKYSDAAVQDHYENFGAAKKKKSLANVSDALPPVDFIPIEFAPPSNADALGLLLKSFAIGLIVAACHLWFFDLLDSSREAILSHQLIWLALPYLAKNIVAGLILSLVIFYFWYKNHDNAAVLPPLTL